MGDKTKIPWSDATWNPVRGCTKVSRGCDNCYAARMAGRFWGPGQPFEGLTVATPNGVEWNGKVRLLPEKLDQPLRWKKPRRIFVPSMSDLFHPEVPFEFIAAVFGVMVAASWHTFIVPTKRPERMLEWFEWMKGRQTIGGPPDDCVAFAAGEMNSSALLPWITSAEWPLRNVHLLVSVEDQASTDERIPLLLQCPAAVRGVSAEPLLGPVDLRLTEKHHGYGVFPGGDPRRFRPDVESCTEKEIEAHKAACEAWDKGEGEDRGPGCAFMGDGSVWTGTGFGIGGYTTTYAGPFAGLDWVICGSESGPGARPMNKDWARDLRDQCTEGGVPFFYKQRLDERGRKVEMPELDGRVWAEYPKEAQWPLEAEEPDQNPDDEPRPDPNP